MTPRLKVTIKTGYGAVEVNGESPEEVLEGLGWLTHELVSQINERASEATTFENEDSLKDIIRVDREGPTIVSREELSHYEAIGLILYAMKNFEATSKQIRERLVSSGKKVTVAARLHEMRNRGHVFKPEKKGSMYKLTSRGVKWIEDDVLARLSSLE
ncbi:MAG TPA: hypothetical protein VMW03_07640 [Candidatus Krumholzibacteriaceae bacterium]|nr:hypothetical protein [Candidatus Krumholzibacteriaceae bacterium]